MSPTQYVSVVLSCAALAACAPGASMPAMSSSAPTTPAMNYDTAPDRLSARDVQALFTRPHHEAGTAASGKTWNLDMKADGSVAVTSGPYADTGQTMVRGDAVCVTYKKMFDGKERCYHYARLGKDTYANYAPDGSYSATLVYTGM